MDLPFRKRMRRRLYYGDKANMDIPSLPMTELSVEYFKGTVSQKLGHVSLDSASDLIKSNQVSPCSMVLSMMYAKRLKQRNKEYLSSMSSSDVFFISMMMASKYLYDEGVEEEVFNDEWADSTDQDIDDVNDMEVEFLKAIDWHLFVRPEEFDDTLAAIEKRLALQEGLKRGWFTYSELAVLADLNLVSGLWTHVGMECSKLTTALSAAYVTSILSMLGSTALAFQLAGPLSTATVAVLSLNLPLMLTPAASHLLPLEMAASSRSLTDGAPADILDFAKRNLTSPDAQMSDHVWQEVSFQGQGKWHSGESGVPGECKEEDMVADGKDGNKEAGEVSDGSNSKRAAPTVTSSLWSLVFLDSLLTQIWSVGSSKRTPAKTDQTDSRPSRPLRCHHWRARTRQRLANPPNFSQNPEVVSENNLSSVNQGWFGQEFQDDLVDLKSVPDAATTSLSPNPTLAHAQQDCLSSNQCHRMPKEILTIQEWFENVYGSCPTQKPSLGNGPARNSAHNFQCRSRCSQDVPLWIHSSNEDAWAAGVFLPSPSMSMVHITPGFHTSIPRLVEVT